MSGRRFFFRLSITFSTGYRMRKCSTEIFPEWIERMANDVIGGSVGYADANPVDREIPLPRQGLQIPCIPGKEVFACPEIHHPFFFPPRSVQWFPCHDSQNPVVRISHDGQGILLLPEPFDP